MANDSETLIRSARRRITNSYRVALSMIALVVIAIGVLAVTLLDWRKDDATLLHMASRQSMLSQRIASLTLQFETMPAEARPATLHELAGLVKEMDEGHHALIHGRPHYDIQLRTPDSLEEIYHSGPVRLDSQIEEFLSHARQVLTLPPERIVPEEPKVAALLRQANTHLIDGLDMAVTRYQYDNQRRDRLMAQAVIGLSALALMMLVMVALAVLRPTINYVTQAQKKLVELNQLKSDFLANMSHEIRTPMNGIIGMTELLIESNLNQRQQHYIKTLQSSADHLLTLINDILDFSKLEAGQMKLEPIRFNFHATIEDVLDIMAPKAREKRLELLVRYVPGTPRFIVADPGRLRQILFNLVGNAVKFTDQGYVLVSVEIMGRRVAPDDRTWMQITIEDTGIGIPEDKIGSLFEKFMQVDSGSTRPRQGTGLGLAISRNLIGLMGGEITVASTPGKGTAFTVQLPIPESNDAQFAQTCCEKFTGLRALLVDDLAPNRLLYAEALTEAGMHCLVAENAEEALTRLKYEASCQRPIELIVTDYIMPGTDGLQLTHMIKRDPAYAKVPVVVLSSGDEHGLVKRFAEAGASAYLTKPAARQQLYDALYHVVTQGKQGRQVNIMTTETSTALAAERLLSQSKALAGLHLLVVEDNRVNLEITTEILQQFGCRVSSAENGQMAVEMAKQERFDLIFMDCQMPVMDGFEAAGHIVALVANGTIAPVPIIALTANALKGDRERCLSAGMDDYLSKPVRKASLEAILLKWLREKIVKPEPVETPLGQAAVVNLLKFAPDEPQKQAKGAPAVAPETCGVDAHVFNDARETLGRKFTNVITYYLEDVEGYLKRIETALATKDSQAIILPAHSIKSSSHQMGVMELSDLARRAEMSARAQAKGEEGEDVKPLLQAMNTAFISAKPFLEAEQRQNRTTAS